MTDNDNHDGFGYKRGGIYACFCGHPLCTPDEQVTVSDLHSRFNEHLREVDDD